MVKEDIVKILVDLEIFDDIFDIFGGGFGGDLVNLLQGETS